MNQLCQRIGLCRKLIALAGASSIGLAAATALSDAPAAKPSTKPASAATTPAAPPQTQPSEKDLAQIKQMEAYYATLYSRPLEIEGNARLAHLIAVTSLSRIDAEEISNRLLFVAKRAKADHRVSQFAWEALANRYRSLTEEQQDTFYRVGLEIADAGGFPAETAGPLLAVLATRPLQADDNRRVSQLLVRVAEENDPETPHGLGTLQQAASAIAAWADRDLISNLLRQMGRSPALAKRIDLMLRGLPSPPPAPAEKGPPPAAAWGKWLTDAAAGLKPKPAALDAKALAPMAAFFGKPERIINPRDPKWNKEIELPRLNLTEVNVAFCVDATGSMAQSNEYVTAYLEMTVKALSVLSPSIRAGAVYYRHESVPAVMVDCCKKAATDRNNFLVRGLPLTKDISRLVKTMRAQVVDPKAGHKDGAGAYLTAITSAADLLGPARKDTVRIAIVVGDTFVTKGSESAIVEVATRAAKTGLIAVFVVKDSKAAASVKPASLAATGMDPVVYSPDLSKFNKPGVDAAEGFVNTAFGTAAQRAIASTLTKEYADRVPPVFKGIWRIFLAEQRGEANRAAAAR